MAEMEKVYCYEPHNNHDALAFAAMANKSNDCNPMAMAAMMNDRNDQWNNPFIYLVWMMYAQRMWGGENGRCNNDVELQAIRTQMAENQNSNLIMDAVKGNANAINQLCGNLNCDFNSLQQSVCDVRSAVQSVGGAVGFSAERVINAVNLGDANVTSMLQNCCCNIRQEIADTRGALQLQMCQDNGATRASIADFKASQQLQMCQQTGTLRDGQRELSNALFQGFAQVGYAAERNKSEIIAAGALNTQRLIDTMNNHWQSELQQKYNDARLELSQLRQNATLIEALRPATTTTA